VPQRLNLVLLKQAGVQFAAQTSWRVALLVAMVVMLAPNVHARVVEPTTKVQWGTVFLDSVRKEVTKTLTQLMLAVAELVLEWS
jgi:hypothetical protein